MCSEIFLRITASGSTLVRSPGLNAMAGAEAGAGEEAVARGPAPCTWLRKSFLVTRPEMPLPWSVAMSTLASLAMRRTSGEDRVRMRSSNVPGRADGLGAAEATGRAGSGERGEAAAGFAA